MLQKEPNSPDTPNNANLPAKPSDDEIIARLRKGARRKRPWTTRSVLVTTLVLGLPLGVVLWWFWPRVHPPELIVVAFDQVTQFGKPVVVRAGLEPLDGGDTRWADQFVFFEEMPPRRSKVSETVKVRTDADGIARTEWTPKTEASVAEIEARYIDDRMRPTWFDRARARIFNWPANSKLLVVDVEPTLTKAGDSGETAKALRSAQAGGWQVVYITTNADTLAQYRKARTWLLDKVGQEADSLLDGPVLARLKMFRGESEATARKTVLASLHAQFARATIYVTADPALKLQTIGGNGEAEGDPVSVTGWDKLVSALLK